MLRLFGSRVISICVFGSVARGEARPNSDIDVLTIMEGLSECVGGRVRETGAVHEALKLTKAYRRLRSQGRCPLISDVLLTPKEVEKHPPILLDIADEGTIIHDPDGFLKRVLASVRARLKALGARKVRTTRGHYWVLKPDTIPGEMVEV